MLILLLLWFLRVLLFGDLDFAGVFEDFIFLVLKFFLNGL